MSLAKADIEQIQALIQQALNKCGEDNNVRYELELRERIVRVEEELKHQRELMMEGFDRMDKRFEMMQTEMDKRFEMMQTEMGKRFEMIQMEMDKRFGQVDKRFEQVDSRFESLQKQMDDRFTALTRRIDRFIVWSFGLTVTAAGVIIAVLK